MKATRAKQNFETIAPSSWDKSHLRKTLMALSTRKVLVIGDVGIDRYTIGAVERISPEAPVPVVWVQEEKHKLGLAANVADNVQALGGLPFLVGLVGKDRGAQDFRALLQESSIDSRHLVTDATRRTVLKERIVSDRQQLLRVDYESAHELAPAAQNAVIAKVRFLLKRVDAVILEDYGKGLVTRELARSVFALAKKAGKLVAVDPNPRTPLEFYSGATVLTPNTKEAEKLSGVTIRDDAGLVAAGKKLLQITRAQFVVITRGKDGMAIFHAKSPKVHLIPTYAREVYDVSGAGDTVISVLAMALGTGASIQDAAILGNLAAGVEVGKRGTATVTPEEVLAALEFFGAGSASGVVLPTAFA
jgi:rfaE bifunctional protein kinase chain/domain